MIIKHYTTPEVTGLTQVTKLMLGYGSSHDASYVCTVTKETPKMYYVESEHGFKDQFKKAEMGKTSYGVAFVKNEDEVEAFERYHVLSIERYKEKIADLQTWVNAHTKALEVYHD